MKGFVIHSSETDITNLKFIFSEMNIELVSPFFNYFNAGIDWATNFKEQIKDSDFIVCYYEDRPNSIFELGMAHGMNKPIFVVVPPNSKIPSDLNSILYVSANFDEEEKIRYNLHIFLNNLKKKALKRHKQKTSKFKGNILTNSFLNNLNISKETSGQEFENYISRIFTELEIVSVENDRGRSKDFVADFSIWLDDLDSIIGNPLLIEIKSTTTIQSLRKAEEQLLKYLERFNGKTGLIIYNDFKLKNKEFETQFAPRILAIGVNKLVLELRNKPISKIIFDLRNSAVHN